MGTLALTLREEDRVVIGDPRAPLGYVSIARIKGDRVRVGFTFPREVPVNREAVAQAIAAEPSEVSGGDMCR